MERLGFFDGPRVGLKAKRPTRADMIERVEEHASRLLGAIQKGYSAGKIDEETFERTEKQIIEVLQRTRDARENKKTEHRTLNVQLPTSNGPAAGGGGKQSE